MTVPPFPSTFAPVVVLALAPARVPDEFDRALHALLGRTNVVSTVAQAHDASMAERPRGLIVIFSNATEASLLAQVAPLAARIPTIGICDAITAEYMRQCVDMGLRAMYGRVPSLSEALFALDEAALRADDATILCVGGPLEPELAARCGPARLVEVPDLAAAWSCRAVERIDAVWVAGPSDEDELEAWSRAINVDVDLAGVPVVTAAGVWVDGVRHSSWSSDAVAALIRHSARLTQHQRRLRDAWRDMTVAHQGFFDVVNAHAIISVADRHGDIVFANELFCSTSGYARDALLGQNHRIVKSDRHDAPFYSDLWQTIRSGRLWRGEVANRRKDGSTYWVQSTIAPWVVPGEHAAGHYLSIRTDVTPIKESAQLLHGLRAALVKLATSVRPELICNDMLELALAMTHSSSGFIVSVHGTPQGAMSVNPLATRGVAWQGGQSTARDSTGNPMHGCECDPRAVPERPFYAHLQDASAIALLRSWFGWPNDAEQVMLLPVHHAHTMVGLVGVSRRGAPYSPTTAEFLDPYDATLGAIIHAIDVVSFEARARRELMAAKAAAEEANHAKSVFLSNMSHELRTPLNVMLGFVQLLDLDNSQPLSAKQREHVNEVMTAGQHLLGLINDVLDLAKIDAGQMRITRVAVNSRAVAQEVARFLLPQFDTKQLTLTIDESDQQWPVVAADPVRLRQILLNLLSNAVKYNRSGGTVRIHAARVSSRRVRISVTDTGHGIPAEQFHALFRPFSRLDPELTGQEGAGIGLFVSRQLAELMEGRMGVYSTVGVGSTFWIELLAAEALPADFQV